MLIKNAQEIKNHLSTVQKNINFDTWKAYIQTAERSYIIPHISKAQYELLNAAHNAVPTTLTAIQTELMSYIQPAIAHYTLYLIFPLLNISVSEQGIVQNQGESFATARQSDAQEARRESIKLADTLLDEALLFLESNKAQFPTWSGSTAYTLSKELLINSAEQFNKYIPAINNSRRAYLRLRPEIQNTENLHIAKTISPALLAEIKTQLLAGTVTANNQKILDLAIPALAHLTMYEALPALSAVISQDGIITFSSYQLTNRESEIANDKILYLRKKHEDNGKTYLAELRGYLDHNASLYPLYEQATNIYTPPPTPEEVIDLAVNNKDSDSTFMV